MALIIGPGIFSLQQDHKVIKHRGILGLHADAKQVNVYIAEFLGLAVKH